MLICENSNSSHINANGVRGDAAGTIGQLDTLLPLCTLDCVYVFHNKLMQSLLVYASSISLNGI